MGLSAIVQSIFDYGFNVNVGGGDFVFGVSVAGIVALVLLAVAFKKWGHLLPFVGKKEE